LIDTVYQISFDLQRIWLANFNLNQISFDLIDSETLFREESPIWSLYVEKYISVVS
jgi:peptidoglycan/LPS O-acetylase OafA/YrhL